MMVKKKFFKKLPIPVYSMDSVLGPNVTRFNKK